MPVLVDVTVRLDDTVTLAAIESGAAAARTAATIGARARSAAPGLASLAAPTFTASAGTVRESRRTCARAKPSAITRTCAAYMEA